MTRRRSTSDGCRTHARIDCPEITEYLRIIETRKVAVCDEQTKFAAYVRKTFADEPLRIDKNLVKTYMGYQRYFPFDLFPWEKCLLVLWLCVYRKDGLPRWPELFGLLGRGAGKNGFMAFCAFCMLSKANGIPKYHVDVCANTEEQAKTTFFDLWDIMEADQDRFKLGYRWNRTEITNLSTDSTLKYRTDNPSSKDGLRSGAVIFDEIHQYADWENLDVFTTGLGKKPCPRIGYITTDGDVRDGPLDAFKARAEAILSGEQQDNGLLPFVCKLDEEREVDDERNWTKANPSLPYLPTLVDEIRREYVNYHIDPTKLHGFMTKRMNVPQQRVDLAVTSWDNLMAASRDVGDLDGMECSCGIDYAKTTDMVGACLVFRTQGEYRCVPHGWFCTRSGDADRIKAPFAEWTRLGLMDMVDDVEVSPTIVAAWIAEMGARYRVSSVAIDSYRHTLMARALDDVGYSAKDGTVRLIRPSDIMLVQPVITSAFATHSIAWGDNPLMRWCANNAKLEPGPHDNYVYGKIEHHSRKTDVFMAFVAAMTQATKMEEYAEPVIMAPLVF